MSADRTLPLLPGNGMLWRGKENRTVMEFSQKKFNQLIEQYSTNGKIFSLDLEKLNTLANKLASVVEESILEPSFWQDPEFTINGRNIITPVNSKDTIQFCLIAVAQFFSYWYKDGSKEKVAVNKVEVYRDRIKTWGINTSGDAGFIDDTIAVLYCIARAVESGIDLLSSKRLKEVTDDDMHEIYRDEKSGKTLIPMPKERKHKFLEIGRGLEKFGRDYQVEPHFSEILKRSNGKLLKLLGILRDYFPFSYGDPFLKLPLLMIKFLWGRLPVNLKRYAIHLECYDNYENLLELEDTNLFEAQADYMVPLFFIRTGIFRVGDPEVLEKLVQNREIGMESDIEKTYRALTVRAIRLLADKITEILEVKDREGTYRGALRFLLDSLFWQNAVLKCREHTYDRRIGSTCSYSDICDACDDDRLMLAGFPLVRTWYY
jgi:hypothetical protein